VLASLRRLARALRLALLCITLAWSSAPAPAASATDAVALIFGADWTVAEHTRAEGSDRTAPARELATGAARGEGEPIARRFTAARAWSRPRRLYVEHRALLC
jgi:hypothetical protein